LPSCDDSDAALFQGIQIRLAGRACRQGDLLLAQNIQQGCG